MIYQYGENYWNVVTLLYYFSKFVYIQENWVILYYLNENQ